MSRIYNEEQLFQGPSEDSYEIRFIRVTIETEDKKTAVKEIIQFKRDCYYFYLLPSGYGKFGTSYHMVFDPIYWKRTDEKGDKMNNMTSLHCPQVLLIIEDGNCLMNVMYMPKDYFRSFWKIWKIPELDHADFKTEPFQKMLNFINYTKKTD